LKLKKSITYSYHIQIIHILVRWSPLENAVPNQKQCYLVDECDWNEYNELQAVWDWLRSHLFGFLVRWAHKYQFFFNLFSYCINHVGCITQTSRSSQATVAWMLLKYCIEWGHSLGFIQPTLSEYIF
jgi:hypothetical protein